MDVQIKVLIFLIKEGRASKITFAVADGHPHHYSNINTNMLSHCVNSEIELIQNKCGLESDRLTTPPVF